MGRPQGCSWGQHVEGAPTALAFRPFRMGLPGNVQVPLCSRKGHKRCTLLFPVSTILPLTPASPKCLTPRHISGHRGLVCSGLRDPISSRMS